MNALVGFAALGIYAMSQAEPRSPSRALLFDALEALLAESCLTLTYADTPSTAAIEAARSTSAWLVRQNPAFAPAVGLLEIVLDAMIGDGDGLNEKLKAIPARARALMQRRLVEIAFLREPQWSASLPPPTTLAAMLKNRFIEWSSFAFLAAPSKDPARNSEIIIATLGELDSDDLLVMMSDMVHGNSDALAKSSGHLINALEQAKSRLSAEKLAIIRCLLATVGVDGCDTPADWITVLRRGCDDMPSAETKHALLTVVGRNCERMFLRKAAQEHLGAEDALRLLQAATPFFSKRPNYVPVLVRESFLGAPAPIRAESETCLRLWQGTVGSDELEALATRQDPIGAMAAAHLVSQLPERVEGYKLRYPYYRVADFRQAFAAAPMAMFKALTEEISLASMIYSADALVRLTDLPLQRRLLKERWAQLSPAQRGALLGILMWGAALASPSVARKAVDRCLDGLNADEIGIAAEHCGKALLVSGTYIQSYPSYERAHDRFATLAESRGSTARMPPSRRVLQKGDPPLETIVRYVSRRKTGDRIEEWVIFLDAVKRMNTPKEARQIARALKRYLPIPSNVECNRLAKLATHLPDKALRAFLDALPPKWQLAVAIATNGKVLAQLDRQSLRAFCARFSPREQALLATLKSIRDALGEANAPRPLNKVEFQAAAVEFVDAVPDRVDYATPSPEVGAFLDALLGRGKGAEIPAAVFEYAASLQRGHYPLAAAVPTPLPVIPRRLERPTPRVR